MKLTAVLLLFVLFIGGCSSPEERELHRGLSLADAGHSLTALETFDHVIKRAPQSPSAASAAREGARISIFILKDYKKATEYLRAVILNSEDPQERMQAQSQLANLYFENLQDYPQAIIEYSRLLAMNPPFSEHVHDQLMISRANFHAAQYEQAESEIGDLLKERLQPEAKFDALQLKGNILVARKKFVEAADLYRVIIKEFPERAAAENVGLQLAVCDEENQDFKGALVVLENMRKTYKQPEYIDLRIKRLQGLVKNQPGAKGFRK